MVNSEIHKGLNALFEDAKELKFAKKIYEATFMGLYEQHKDLMARIIETCEKEENPETVIEEISGVLPQLLQQKLDEAPSKRKKESVQLDCNTVMVTYIVPVIGYSRNEACEAIIDRMIAKWNDISNLKIQKAHFEDIQGGFKSRLCYITTSVCKSMDKPDDCYELCTLRDYRDNYLAKQEEDSGIIEEYYDVAPTIVKRINELADADGVYRSIWETYLNPCISMIERDEKSACKELYIRMVKELENKYIYS